MARGRPTTPNIISLYYLKKWDLVQPARVSACKSALWKNLTKGGMSNAVHKWFYLVLLSNTIFFKLFINLKNTYLGGCIMIRGPTTIFILNNI